ncbi:hypothetical protein F4692_003189 [Nocardioides cavernae]|uniref:Uncharacterized protein n=1 Tax=Nocardioides cavernae TaxID=1921566 RepID=A0A7Y9H500_9ACTN|nr:hypothetical protein [Nocardioides cavernae]NYE38044.1 hypothetical protein [Nocardioides cavernae]
MNQPLAQQLAGLYVAERLARAECGRRSRLAARDASSGSPRTPTGRSGDPADT